MMIPLVSFHYCHLIFTLRGTYITGGCSSSTIQPTMANPRMNQTPLCECLATCLEMQMHQVKKKENKSS